MRGVGEGERVEQMEQVFVQEVAVLVLLDRAIHQAGAVCSTHDT